MSKTTKSYPVVRKILLTETQDQAIEAYARRKDISCNQAVRELLDSALGVAATVDGAAAVQEMIRAVVREELQGPLAHIAATTERGTTAAERIWNHFKPQKGDRYYEPNKY
jgi:glycerol-3-phosphate O-acyltransferase